MALAGGDTCPGEPICVRTNLIVCVKKKKGFDYEVYDEFPIRIRSVNIFVLEETLTTMINILSHIN